MSSSSNGSFVRIPRLKPRAGVPTSCLLLILILIGAHKRLLSPLESAIVLCANGDVDGKRAAVSTTCHDSVRRAILRLRRVPWPAACHAVLAFPSPIGAGQNLPDTWPLPPASLPSRPAPLAAGSKQSRSAPGAFIPGNTL